MDRIPFIVEHAEDVLVVRVPERTKVNAAFVQDLVGVYETERQRRGAPIKALLVCPDSMSYGFTFLWGSRSEPFSDLLSAHAIVVYKRLRRKMVSAHKDLFPRPFAFELFAEESAAMAWLAQQ